MLTIPAKKRKPEAISKLFEKIGTGSVFQKEKGEKTGYEHYQCFLQVKSPMRFSTLKNVLTKAGFKDAHIEKREGSVAECVAYCTKQETHIAGPFHTGKIRKRDSQGKRSDLIEARKKILSGESVDDVLYEDVGAKLARYPNYLNAMAAVRDRRRFGKHNRHVAVYYLWGDSGVGKTRHVYEKYPIENIYRITDYSNPFDEYTSQPVLVLDEFNSQFSWNKILVYLDRYPVVLPARYHNRQACYTTVWIISNLPLSEQYVHVTGRSRRALLRRIKHCYHMDHDGHLNEEDPYKVGWPKKPDKKSKKPNNKLEKPGKDRGDD